MCINFRDRENNRYTVDEELSIRLAIQALFKNSEARFITQNGNFDSTWLYFKDRIHLPRVHFDTMLAHHTLYPRLPHDLGFIVSQYTFHPFYKDDIAEFKEGGDIDLFWKYNVKDATLLLPLREAMDRELEQQGMSDFFYNHVMKLQPHLVNMTVNGIKVDLSLRESVHNEVAADVINKAEELYSKLAAIIGDNTYRPNLKSNPQLVDMLFDKLSLLGIGRSVNKESRSLMRSSTGDDGKLAILNLLDEYKKQVKFLQNVDFNIDYDGRARCEYKQHGTTKAPGRLSSSKTMWGSGENLQNQPKRAFPLYIADEGWEFTYFDFSQAEARVFATAWNVESLIENFERADKDKSFDVHRANASRIFNVDYDKVPTEDRTEDGTPTIRFIGKRCVYGLGYRMMPPK